MCFLTSAYIPGQKHRGLNKDTVLSRPMWPALSCTHSKIRGRNYARITNWCSFSGDPISPVVLLLYNRFSFTQRRVPSFTRPLRSWLRLGPLGHGEPLIKHWMICEMAGSSFWACRQSMVSPTGDEQNKSGMVASSVTYASTVEQSVVTYWHMACTTGWETLPGAAEATQCRIKHQHLCLKLQSSTLCRTHRMIGKLPICGP